MLDSDTCIYTIKRHPSQVSERLASIPPDEIAVSSIVIAELWFGVSHSLQRKRNESALTTFLDHVATLDWPGAAAPLYGRVRAALKRTGVMIGAMDLLIATHALALNAVLVTHNIGEFSRVPGLKVEDWVTPRTRPQR